YHNRRRARPSEVEPQHVIVPTEQIFLTGGCGGYCLAPAGFTQFDEMAQAVFGEELRISHRERTAAHQARELLGRQCSEFLFIDMEQRLERLPGRSRLGTPARSPRNNQPGLVKLAQHFAGQQACLMQLLEKVDDTLTTFGILTISIEQGQGPVTAPEAEGRGCFIHIDDELTATGTGDNTE